MAAMHVDGKEKMATFVDHEKYIYEMKLYIPVAIWLQSKLS